MTKAVKAKTRSHPSLTMANIIVGDFQMALTNLMNSQNLPVKASYALLKTFKEISTHQKDYEDLRAKLLEKYGKKDDAGNLMMNEGKTQYLVEDRTAFDNEYRDLLNLPIEVSKVPMSYIADAKLSPAMLSVLVDSVINPQL